MDQIYRPNWKRGAVLHTGALLFNLAAVAFLVLLALTQNVRGFFILYLIAGLVVFLPVPLIAYRLFSLLRASYIITRDSIRIQWGLRFEEIPMQDIEWVRMADDIAFNLPLPGFSFHGAVLGIRSHHDLGPIEFIASTFDSLVLIATQSQIFAVSPTDPPGFIQAINRNLELGSITPVQAKTTRVDLLVGSLLKDKAARILLLLGTVLSISLLIAVSFIIPKREFIPLGFNPIGQVVENSPSDRLLLLPILSLLMLVIDVGLGSYLYRKTGYRMAAYFTFASSLIVPISFLGLLIYLFL